MFTILSATSELERDLIRERVLAGVRRAQAAGKHAAVRARTSICDPRSRCSARGAT